MFMNRLSAGYAFTLWCLLLLWVFFGGLELAEQLQLVQETAAEDQPGQDLDEEALAELASGLKSAASSIDGPCYATLPLAVAELTVSHTFNIVHQFKRLMRHSPASRSLHQKLCVYRI